MSNPSLNARRGKSIVILTVLLFFAIFGVSAFVPLTPHVSASSVTTPTAPSASPAASPQPCQFSCDYITLSNEPTQCTQSSPVLSFTGTWDSTTDACYFSATSTGFAVTSDYSLVVGPGVTLVVTAIGGESAILVNPGATIYNYGTINATGNTGGNGGNGADGNNCIVDVKNPLDSTPPTNGGDGGSGGNGGTGINNQGLINNAGTINTVGGNGGNGGYGGSGGTCTIIDIFSGLSGNGGNGGSGGTGLINSGDIINNNTIESTGGDGSYAGYGGSTPIQNGGKGGNGGNGGSVLSNSGTITNNIGATITAGSDGIGAGNGGTGGAGGAGGTPGPGNGGNGGTSGNGGTVVSNSGTINNYGIIAGTAGDSAFYGAPGGAATGSGTTGGSGGNGGNGGNGLDNSGTINNYGSSPGIDLGNAKFGSYNHWPNPGRIDVTGGNPGQGGSGGTGPTNSNGGSNNGSPGQTGDYGGNGVYNSGKIYNYATIYGTDGNIGYDLNNVGFYNSASGFLGNLGTITTQGGYTTDSFYNYGTINNDGDLVNNYINNQNTINNYCSSPINVDNGYQPNPITCYYVTFEPSGLPSSGEYWGFTINWPLFPVQLNVTVSGYAYLVDVTGSISYSFYTPVNDSGTILNCTAGCSGNPSISSAVTYSATYTAVSTTSVSCSPKFLALLASATCTATVHGSSPTGGVTFTNYPGYTGTFTPADGVCPTLTQINASASSCSITYTAVSAGVQLFFANYTGDAHNLASTGLGGINVNLTVSITTSNGAEICSSGTFNSGHLPGTWSGDTCNIGNSFGLESGETLDIGAGVVIENAFGSNQNPIISTGVSSTINNYGSVYIYGYPCPVADTHYVCFGVTNDGTINNYGTFSSAGQSAGIYNNGGTINNAGTLSGEGTGFEYYASYYGIWNDHGIINNAGTLSGFTDYTNNGYYTYGINNSGTINNAGDVIGSSSQYAGISNAGTINDYCSSAQLQSSPDTLAPNNSYSCHTVTFNQNGIPTSGIAWDVTASWSPSSGVTFIALYQAYGGASIQEQLTGSLTYSYDTPINNLGATYKCTAGCSETASISSDTSLSATYEAFTTSVSCSSGVVGYGELTTCTATVTGSSPTGTVFFSSGTGTFTPPSGECTLSAGSCSVNYSSTTIGTTTITASYHGDSSNIGSSGTFSLTVVTLITSSNGPSVCVPSGSYTNGEIPGNWSSSTDTCSSTTGFFVSQGAAIEIGNGVTLEGIPNGENGVFVAGFENAGIVFNYGTIISDLSGNSCGQYAKGIVQDSGGVLYNYGNMTGNGETGIYTSGTIDNAGTMNGGGSTCSGSRSTYIGVYLAGGGTINNAGNMNGFGTCNGIYDAGGLNNAGKITGTANGSGCGTDIFNYNLITDYCDGSVVGSLYDPYIYSLPSCYSVTFSQSGIPSGVTWGIATSWSPSSGVTFIALYQTDTRTSLTEQLIGPLTYSYYTPINSSGVTYNCATGCSGTSSIAADTSLSLASYTAIITSYSVTFDQTGIPSSVTWSVTVGTNTYSGQGSIAVSNLQGTLTYSYESSVSGTTGTQYECTGATCSGSVDASTGTITSAYQTQYLISFAQTGSASAVSVQWDFGNGTSGTTAVPFNLWADSTTSLITYSYPSSVAGSSGIQYELTAASPASPYSIANGPATITGTYQTQYLISFTQSGSSSAPLVTWQFGNDTSGSGTVPFAIWADASTSNSLSYTYQSSLAGGSGIQYELVSVSPASISPISAPGTIAGSYQTQYLITFNQVGSGSPVTVSYSFGGGNSSTGSVAAGSGIWVDASTTSISFTYPATVSGGTGTRYALTSVDTASPLTISSPATITGTYGTQYLLTVNGGNNVQVNPSSTDGWYDSGTSLTVSSDWTWSDNSGQRIAITNYQIDGVNQNPGRQSSGTLTTSSITMGSAHTITFVSVTQYYLAVNGGNGITYGTPSPTADNWYDSGSSTTVSSNGVYDRSAGTGERVQSWNLDGGTANSAFTTGTVTTSSITMDGPHTVSFNSIEQYYLTDNNPSGAESSITAPTIVGDTGWYDQGTVASVSLNNVYGAISTQRNNLVSYTLDATTTPVTRADSGTQSFPVTMNQPSTISSTYNVQYFLTITGGNNVQVSATSPTNDGWYDSGTALTVSSDWTWNANSGQRTAISNYLIDGASQNPSRQASGTLTTIIITMTAARIVAFQSVTQYSVTVTSAYGTISLTGSQTGDNWFDSGSSAIFSVTSPVACGTGCQEFFIAWTGSGNGAYSGSDNPATITVGSAITETSSFVTQYLVTFEYTVSGGGSPTAPTVSYTSGGVSETGTASQSSPTSAWVDSGTSITYTNALGSSGASERWQTNLPISSSSSVIDSSVSGTETLNPTYYHQFLVSFGYTTNDGTTIDSVSNLVSYTQFGSAMQLSTDVSGTLSLSSDWADAGTPVTFVSPVSVSSNERYQISPADSGSNTVISSVSSSSTSATPEYYHQFQVAFAYSTSDGTVSNPSVAYTQFDTASSVSATQSGVPVWADSTTSYSYANPTSGSSSIERWMAPTTPAGTISSSATVTPEYYHQYYVTFSYSLGGTPAGTPASGPTATFSQFGTTSGYDIATQAGVSDWVDAGSSVLYSNPLPGSSGTERWQNAATVPTFTVSTNVGSSTTLSAEYYHQFSVSWSYVTQDGSTTSPALTFSGTQFGSSYAGGSSGSAWLDAGTTASFPSSIPSSPTNERWITSATEALQPGYSYQTSITVGSGSTVLATEYYHQYLVTASYSTSDGSTPSSNVVLSGTTFGGDSTTDLATSTTTIWLDAGSSWSVNSLITAGSGTERWDANGVGISGTVSSPVTIAPFYYHQYLVGFAYTTSDSTSLDSQSNLVSYTQFGVTLHLSTDSSGVLSKPSDWADAGSQVAYVSPVTIASNQERYQISLADSGANTVISSVSASSTSANPEYYHQFLVTFAYSTSDGSVSNPDVSYYQFGTGLTATATQTGTSVWADSTTTYSYADPTSGSSSMERWMAPTTPAGTVLSSTTVTPTYYHQFSVTWSYITQDGSTPTVAFSGTQFGNPYNAGGSGTNWLDATTLASFQSSIPSSPTNERWTTSPGEAITQPGYSYLTSITVGSGSTILATEYYHQYLVTASYSTSDSTTPTSNVAIAGTVFGGVSTTTLDTTPQTTWLDATTGWSVNNPIMAPSNTERWYAPSGTSGTITGATTISPEYDHEFLLTVATDPSGLSPSPSITPPAPYASGWYSAGTPVTLTANTVSGNTFILWQVDGTNGTVLATSITITMDQTHTAVAYYEQPANSVQTLISNVNIMNLQQGTQTSLDAKLNAAISSLNSGNTKTATNQLNAFINAVNAQSGKHIDTSQAQLLASFAQDIIDSIAT